MKNYKWLNKPQTFVENDNTLTIKTQRGTDMWQQTHYGFSKNNVPTYYSAHH